MAMFYAVVLSVPARSPRQVGEMPRESPAVDVEKETEYDLSLHLLKLQDTTPKHRTAIELQFVMQTIG